MTIRMQNRNQTRQSELEVEVDGEEPEVVDEEGVEVEELVDPLWFIRQLFLPRKEKSDLPR